MTASRIVLTSIMANLSAYDISQMTAAPVWFVRRGVSRREGKADLTPALSLEEREMTSLACGHPLSEGECVKNVGFGVKILQKILFL